MRLKKSGHGATQSKPIRPRGPQKHNADASVAPGVLSAPPETLSYSARKTLPETPVYSARPAYTETPALPTRPRQENDSPQQRDAGGHRDEPKILRRQDYAAIYQVGRRSSTTMHKKMHRTGSAPAAGFGNAPATAVASAYSSPLHQHKRDPRLFLAIACAAVLTAAVVFGAITLLQGPAMAKGQEVIFDGRMLCIAQSPDIAQKALTQIQDDLKKTYGMAIQNNQKLTFTPVTCDSSNICSAKDVQTALKNNIDVKVMAAVIMVNDRPAVALRSQGEAQQALDALLAPFKDAPAERLRTDISFVENVQIEEMPTDYSLVQPVDTATHTLTLGANVQDNPYTVKKGDSLGKIAKKFSLTTSDIRKANPVIASTDVIQPDMTLNAVKPNNWVNIRYTETVTRQEVLPFDTIKQTSASMYTTQKQVSQKGKNGERDVVAKVTFINGVQTQEDVLSQTVVTPALNQIELRGTKKVPTNAGSGSGSGSGGGVSLSGSFICPVKSYRVSSEFEKRTLNGVTRWHYGIDLAAPTGTPIYASRTGTVNYAGSASGYGLVIYLDHDSGIQTRYGHCSKLLVSKGQHVTQGQLIGLVGATGDATGPHCHFEIRVNGTPYNPRKYLKFS